MSSAPWGSSWPTSRSCPKGATITDLVRFRDLFAWGCGLYFADFGVLIPAKGWQPDLFVFIYVWVTKYRVGDFCDLIDWWSSFLYAATTLTAFHFTVTAAVGYISSALGYSVSKHVPFKDLFLFSLVSNTSIVAMNLGLMLNSVGFYQVIILSHHIRLW